MFAMRFGIFLFAFLLPLAAQAQTPAAPKPAPAKPLDTLFNDLKSAQTEQDAKAIGDRIEKLFQQSGSPSIDLLMNRANVALAASDNDTARKLVNTVTQVAPDFAEGWRTLAGMQASSGDDEGAMLSLGRTVTLNPRHYAAMMELAEMFESYGNKAGALKLYRQALAVNPHLDAAKSRIHALAREVEGQGI